MSRILGLVSYYLGATPDKYASKVYNFYENIEEEKEKNKKTYVKKKKIRKRMSRRKIGNDISTYSSYTRQACNFVFPKINDKNDGKNQHYNPYCNPYHNL